MKAPGLLEVEERELRRTFSYRFQGLMRRQSPGLFHGCASCSVAQTGPIISFDQGALHFLSNFYLLIAF